MLCFEYVHTVTERSSQTAKFMGPTWGPPGSWRPQMGSMLPPWTLLSGVRMTPMVVPECVEAKLERPQWWSVQFPWRPFGFPDDQGPRGHHGAHLGPIGPRWAHVGSMNFVIWELHQVLYSIVSYKSLVARRNKSTTENGLTIWFYFSDITWHRPRARLTLS